MNERILIVEDDPAISKLIDTNLTLSGYQTFCAMDGRQAVEVVQAQCFDLALCDIMLPELDGFELLPYDRFISSRNSRVITTVPAHCTVRYPF